MRVWTPFSFPCSYSASDKLLKGRCAIIDGEFPEIDVQENAHALCFIEPSGIDGILLWQTE